MRMAEAMNIVLIRSPGQPDADIPVSDHGSHGIYPVVYCAIRCGRTPCISSRKGPPLETSNSIGRRDIELLKTWAYTISSIKYTVFGQLLLSLSPSAGF